MMKKEQVYIYVNRPRMNFLILKMCDSRSGWPAFYAPIKESSVVNTEDYSHGMARTEVKI